MKIWKAELCLFYNFDNEWETDFSFELQEEEYKINEKFNEWICFEDWVNYRIPMDMAIDNNGYTGFKVVQGFDNELNKEELIKLEKDMRDLMKKKLEIDKKRYLKDYENKIKAI
ncbi:TPA: hypothetical protein LA460_000075 [Clostridium botulinum]|nr:hypothetical protein [Clostridium botulinum]HBJ1652680.1 hypothetical protein [Clostridium botulinum]